MRFQFWSTFSCLPLVGLFPGYILLLVPGTKGSINIWDGGFITYDPLAVLEPQNFIIVLGV